MFYDVEERKENESRGNEPLEIFLRMTEARRFFGCEKKKRQREKAESMTAE